MEIKQLFDDLNMNIKVKGGNYDQFRKTTLYFRNVFNNSSGNKFWMNLEEGFIQKGKC